MVGPVLFRHIVDDLAPAFKAEVDVKVGHADPLLVEEALEEEVIFQGIDIGDEEGIGCQGGRPRPPARAHHDLIFMGEADKIPDNQIVVGKTHVVDHRQLVIQALLIGLAADAGLPLDQAFIQAFITKPPQHGLARLPFCRLKMGERDLTGLQVHLAAPGDDFRIFQSLGHMGKEGLHFLRGADIEGVRVHLHPVGRIHGLARLHTKEDLMGEGILGQEVVAVIGGHQGNPRLLADLDQVGIDPGLVGQIVALDFQEKVALAKEVLVFQGLLDGLVPVPLENQPGQFTGQAGRQGDQTLVMGLQQGLVHPGPVIEAIHKTGRDQLDQIPVTLIVLGQENQVVGVPVQGPLLFLVTSGRHIDLTANDGMDAIFFHGPVKIQDPIHGPVVGNGAGIHAQLLQAGGQFMDPVGAIKQAVFRMKMQVGKGHGYPIRLLSFRLPTPG